MPLLHGFALVFRNGSALDGVGRKLLALLIPKIGAARFDTSGELRFAERLAEKLEDNAIVWHNIPIGPRGRYPDFIALHPHRGLLALEVKDWRIESIARADKLRVELITAHGIVAVQNPIEQVREYLFAVKHLLERDALLVCPAGSPFVGKLAAPFGWGVVLTNITRRQFDATDLREVIAPSRVMCRDEMSESVDAEHFCERLWGMVSPRLGPPLSLPQIDRIRGLMFPEIVVRDDRQAVLFDDEPADANERLLHVMDLQQEQLARSIGEGHRVIRGVAGSGKTMLLTFRAEHIAKVATRPVLVLCYNRALSARLEARMQDRGFEDKVITQTFHSWCWRMLRQYDLELPKDADFDDQTARLADVVRRVVRAVDAGHIPSGQYDAVLIDEAHDFEHDWLQLAARMVNPDTRSLLVLYDNAQSIYGSRKTPVWSHLGIEAKGRTTVMKLNYRNTAEIFAFARRFAADILAEPFDDDEGIATVMLPESCGRRGVEPILERRSNASHEAYAAADWFSEKKRAGYAWRDMALLVPSKNWREHAARALERDKIPFEAVFGAKERAADFSSDKLRVLTMHSAKGLEFPAVAMIGLGDLPFSWQELPDAARLVYVGMTRATHALSMSYSKPSALIERLLSI